MKRIDMKFKTKIRNGIFQVNIYKELAKVARNRGETVKAEQLEKRARDAGKDNDENIESDSESDEDREEEEVMTPCDRLTDDRILDKCIGRGLRHFERKYYCSFLKMFL